MTYITLSFTVAATQRDSPQMTLLYLLKITRNTGEPEMRQAEHMLKYRLSKTHLLRVCVDLRAGSESPSVYLSVYSLQLLAKQSHWCASLSWFGNFQSYNYGNLIITHICCFHFTTVRDTTSRAIKSRLGFPSMQMQQQPRPLFLSLHVTRSRLWEAHKASASKYRSQKETVASFLPTA